MIDGTTATVIATIGTGTVPMGLGVDPSTHTVYVADIVGVVSVIDGTTNAITATVPVGNTPFGVGVDP